MNITRHAADAHPFECIGFIVQRANKYWAVAMPAVAHARHVYIDSSVLIPTIYLFQSHDIRVVATYHSHPNGSSTPSELDKGLFLSASTMIVLAFEHQIWVPYVFTHHSSD